MVGITYNPIPITRKHIKNVKKVARTCLTCKKSFLVWECKLKTGRGNYCSSLCSYSAKKSVPTWNTGKTKTEFPQLSRPQTEQFKAHMREVMKGKQNCLGRIVSDETKRKLQEAHRGKHYEWSHARKGVPNEKVRGKLNGCWKERPSYRTIHKWVVWWKGKPNKCELCGLVSDRAHTMHWANIDHVYRRDLTNWMRLCVSCHTKYDKEHGLKEKKWRTFSNTQVVTRQVQPYQVQ